MPISFPLMTLHIKELPWEKNILFEFFCKVLVTDSYSTTVTLILSVVHLPRKNPKKTIKNDLTNFLKYFFKYFYRFYDIIDFEIPQAAINV